MLKMFCRKLNYHNFKYKKLRKEKLYFEDFMPTYQKMKSEVPKLMEIKKMVNINKYLKRQDIIEFIFNSSYMYFSLYIKSVRILRKEAIKVRNIPVHFINKAVNIKDLDRIRDDIEQKKISLTKIYEPQNIEVNLKKIKVDSDKYKQFSTIIFSLVLFTIDKLKEEAFDNEEIEINRRDYSGDLFSLIYGISESDLGPHPIAVGAPLTTYYIMYTWDYYVRVIKKTSDNEKQVKETKISIFLEKIISDFEFMTDVKFSEDEKKILIKVVIYAIGVFTFIYVIHFIDFRKLFNDFFVDATITMNLKKKNKGAVVRNSNNYKKAFYLKNCSREALDKMHSLPKIYHGSDIYLSNDGELTTDKKAVSDTKERFLFSLKFEPEQNSWNTIFEIKTKKHIKYVMKVLGYITGWRLKKDAMYKLASFLMLEKNIS